MPSSSPSPSSPDVQAADLESSVKYDPDDVYPDPVSPDTLYPSGSMVVSSTSGPDLSEMKQRDTHYDIAWET